MDDAASVPTLSAHPDADGRPACAASGAWTLATLASRFGSLQRDVGAVAARDGAWDLTGITALDGMGALLLWRGWGRRRPAALILRPEHEAIFRALAQAPLSPPPKARPARLVRLGRALAAAAGHALDGLALAGLLALDALAWLRHVRQVAWREISANVYRAGAQSLPITGVVGFLVGVTLSHLTSRQLKTLGADAFIVDILGIGVWRELGPLLAAILVAGRSGSAMTAQLGVMRVTQELDALSVMGISHTARLVLPKVIALAAALPLVTVWTCVAMFAGGALSAQLQLGMDPLGFVGALPAAVPVANLVLGFAKAAGFGVVIALVACHFGLRVKPDTESLAAGTTSSVVTAITAVIVLDAVVAVVFSDVGLR